MCNIQSPRIYSSDDSQVETYCPLVLDLKMIGLSHVTSVTIGCLEHSEWLEKIVVQNHHSHFNSLMYIDLPYKKLTRIRTVSQGKFGYIDVARYETKEEVKEVYVKRPIRAKTSLLMEACIQHVVRNGLAHYGFANHVPQVIDVFQLLDGLICFSMVQVEGSMTLDTYFNRHPSADISNELIEILYQVIMMIWSLNYGLGINHRDLKPSNFLIRTIDNPKTYSFTIDHLHIEWSTIYHLDLIDFGFACGGKKADHTPYLSLSTVYPKDDPCPKDGRDLFMFLAILYGDYYSRMSHTLRRLFESWININGSMLSNFIRKDKDRALEWIYFLTGSANVKSIPCYPHLILLDLMRLRNGSVSK